MKKPLKLISLTMLFVAMALGTAMGQTKDVMEDLIDFSPEQITALAGVAEEQSVKLQTIINKIEEASDQLFIEAVKDEGPEVPKTLRKDPKKIDKLIRELASLVGDILKTKTEYLLKAKGVLTPEQRKKLIADLDYQVDFFNGESPFLFRLDDLAEILDLSTDQIKSAIKLRTDMMVKELKMKMDIAFQLVDIKEILDSDERQPGDIDDKVMKIADIGAKVLMNKIDYILKSRSVLTGPQKQELHQLVLLTFHAASLIN
ncbi:hypothetical protein JCM14469_40230 [Desulfatiferula olefinivorans]